MTKPGLRKLQCEVCGQTRELEAGIKTMYCCAQKMVDVTMKESEEEPETIRLKRKD